MLLIQPSEKASREEVKLSRRVKRYGVAVALFWTVAAGVSLVFDLVQVQVRVVDAARIQARREIDKDVLYLHWNALQGGMYVPAPAGSNASHPGDGEQEPKAASGPKLARVNPVNMTRQVYELERKENGIQSHLTSLNPEHAADVPDPWEVTALDKLKAGSAEVSEQVKADGANYLRMIRPLLSEESCLKCHGKTGPGNRHMLGGMSVKVPVAPYRNIARAQTVSLVLGHAVLWFLVLIGIAVAGRRIFRQALEREALVSELEKALSEVKVLSGLLPICAWCKKIRNDQGYWTEIEAYLSEHSKAEFTHGVCQECLEKLLQTKPDHSAAGRPQKDLS